MNKIGILYGYWSKEWDIDYIPYIHKVKQLGFDILEINTTRLLKMCDDEIKIFNDTASEAGIDISAVFGMPDNMDVGSPNASIRNDAIEYQKNLIKICAKAGIPSISGILYSGWLAKLENHHISKAQCWKNSTTAMKEIASFAEDHNINLNLEVVNRFENYLLNCCSEALEYISDVDRPNLFILLDTFHMNIEEDSLTEAIKLAGDKLGHFHVGENNRRPPGVGFLPWQEIFQALKDIHYQKAIVMEPFIQMGGTIGSNISVYREIMPGADFDAEAKKSLEFIKNTISDL